LKSAQSNIATEGEKKRDKGVGCCIQTFGLENFSKFGSNLRLAQLPLWVVLTKNKENQLRVAMT